jgi:S-adenosylmethionine:diacylglycerol 3-amino-3-carboxypropyl transferase
LKPPPQRAQDLKPEPAGPASEELDRLARSMAREKKYSYQQAFSRIYSDPERAELVARVRQEEAELRARVAAQRFPTRNAERESKTREWIRS